MPIGSPGLNSSGSRERVDQPLYFGDFVPPSGLQRANPWVRSSVAAATVISQSDVLTLVDRFCKLMGGISIRLLCVTHQGAPVHGRGVRIFPLSNTNFV